MDHFALGVAVGLVVASMAFGGFGLVHWSIAPWFKCFLSGTPVSLVQIVGMRLRGSPVQLLVGTYTSLVHSGVPVKLDNVESAYIANRHRIVQPRDLFEIVKQNLESHETARRAEA